MIDKFFCKEDSILLDALEVINKNEKGIAFIVNSKNELLGILTDGDIRRSLLNGASLQEKSVKYANKNFEKGFQETSIEELIKKTNKGKNIIPILDRDNSIIDYFEYKAETNIPVAAPYLQGNEFKYLTEAFLSTWISSSGKYITKFEHDFSNFIGTKYSIAVSNGTCALHLALTSLGIGPGDEVIVPDLTFAATINAVLHAGATPVIVDIEKDSWCISAEKISEAITKKTKAIICVHLFGQPCEMDTILNICKEHDLRLIEDCAQAHGAKYKGKVVGSFGDVGCFSFFANKIITTGEGGICTTNSIDLDSSIRLLRDHGMNKSKRYWHDNVGYNYRLTNLQAAIGVAQLEKVEQALSKRSEIEERYKAIIKKFNFLEVQKNNIPHNEKVTWLVCATAVDNNKRNMIIEVLSKNGIDTRPFFYSLSEMPLYKDYVRSNKNSLEISQKGLSFPTILNLENNYFEKFENILKSKVSKVLQDV